MSKSAQEFRLEQRFRRRLYFFASLFFCIILLFISQLGSLQLLHGYENRVLAKKFVSHQEFTVAPRGLFFDRSSKLGDEPLVQNLRFINFIVHPDQFKNYKQAIEYVKLFCSIMGREYSDYAHYFQPKSWDKIIRKNKSITLLERMTRREHERLAAFHIATEQGEYVTQHLRHYTMGPALAHITGYIGLPSPKELKKKLVQSYQTIGKGGLEARYDNHLRGRDGVRARYRVIDYEEQISTTEQGDNLILTIDKKIQSAAYKALVNISRRGTAVVMEANSGRILAMASHPSFDPNILASGTPAQRKKHLREIRLHKGFINLTIQAQFPPASTLKPLIALAALEDTELDQGFQPKKRFLCRGYFTLRSSRPGRSDARFDCWRRHGYKSMIDAIAHSCNVYFYNLGYQIGASSIIKFARVFGLDKETGIDLLGEQNGHVPDQRWKQLTFSSRWYDGDTINLSIGQGFLQTTPLQLAVLYSAIANRGKIYRPYLVQEIRDSIDHHLIKEFSPVLLREIPLSLKSVAAIQEGLRKVVTKGTAKRLSSLGIPIAGKTGTVQTRSKRRKRKQKDHAWFASYAPYGDKLDNLIVVVVFVEYGRAGSASAAPVAAEIYKAIFPNRKKRRVRKRPLKLRNTLQQEQDNNINEESL